MTNRTSAWPVGTPCWATLASSDEAAARAFYTGVLGWSFRDIGPRRHHWTLAEVDGGVVAGIGAVPEDGTASWLLAFATDDVDRAAATVVNAGGTVQQPPHEVLDGAARAAVGRDAGGIRFALLEAGSFAGATVVNRPGAVVWEDGLGDQPDRNRAFYTELFGWEYTTEPGTDEAYRLFHAPGDPRPWGGLGARSADTPALWCPWFGVESVDGAVEAVVTGGGAVLSGPHDTAWGRLAQVQDPEGAVFGVMAPDFADLPDRSG